jgi:uncharacterized protein
MKISGSYSLPFAPEKSYAVLQDPNVLTQCLPGVERMDKIGEDEYAMVMKMAIASFSGAFQGKVKVEDQQPFTSYRMVVEGTGKIGFMKGSGALQFQPEGEGTLITYEGDVQVGGMLASVGSRLIDTTSKMIIKRFFDKLVEVAT